MTVYCIRRAIDKSLLKIGFTSDLQARLRSYRRSHPEGIELLVAINGGRDLEAFILVVLAGDRVHGEWVKQSPLTDVIIASMEAVAKKRGGIVGDIECAYIDQPEFIASQPNFGLNEIFTFGPDLSLIPKETAERVQDLSWEERRDLAVALRTWAADAAEWVMPELKSASK